MASNPKGIIYIDRGKIDFFEQGLTNPLSLPFPPTIVRDLEVINKEELAKLIKSFIDQNKLVPAQLHFVLANTVIIEKNFDTQKTPNIDEVIKTFLDVVPFENIITKKIVLGTITKITAVNADYLTALKDIFESNGFKLDATILYFEINPNAVSQNSLSNQDITTIMNKFDSFRQLSIIQSGDSQNEDTGLTQRSKEFDNKLKNKKLPLLLIIFAILVLLLLFLLFRR